MRPAAYIIRGEYIRGSEHCGCSLYKWLKGGRESLMGRDEEDELLIMIWGDYQVLDRRG